LFLGSGVSAKVASQLKRHFIGYENDLETYNQIIGVLN
jgi:DNA modification methylase